ncbi:ribosomal RNA small subunit methyltransferase I isoform X6 [Capsicum annuum]|uniref:ribosomal RNA small subunit methyltransferase I isoform X6 n=1 Tax=Capsicum annuum TaxID=4072 RepID=UPI001FB18EAC|nr:ribosomal RNA small subunit methyltransferase I isoform X6 [Capsicum annuum]
MLLRLYNPMSILSSSMFTQIPRQFYKCPLPLFTHSVQPHISTFPRHFTLSFYSNNAHTSNTEAPDDLQLHLSNSKQSPLKPGLYLVGTPIGNLEDITLRALRVLKSADVILSEDTRHSGKLLHYYNIKTPLLSYHKFNESQRAQVVLRKLQDGEIVALISDAGTPGISDPGMELAKLCADKNIPVVPIPGPSAVVTALSASGLPTNEFTFVGFLPKHSSSRRERLILSANESATQIFFIPPHKLCQFLEEAAAIFGKTRQCVMAREMTKVHEEAVKLVASGKLMKRKAIYSLALRKFGGQVESEDD